VYTCTGVYKQSKEKMGKKKRKSLLELLKMELYYCHPSLALKLMLLHFCVQELCFQP
jgi:hypothetical protein